MWDSRRHLLWTHLGRAGQARNEIKEFGNGSGPAMDQQQRHGAVALAFLQTDGVAMRCDVDRETFMGGITHLLLL